MERQLHNTINEYELGNKELASKVHTHTHAFYAVEEQKISWVNRYADG